MHYALMVYIYVCLYTYFYNLMTIKYIYFFQSINHKLSSIVLKKRNRVLR